MLALCPMLHPTDYAKNYAGIMGTGLPSIILVKQFMHCTVTSDLVAFHQ